MRKTTNKSTSVITSKIYPKIATSLDRNTPALKRAIGNFISSRYNELYDSAPNDRIYFGVNELDEFYKAIKISPKEIENDLINAFWWDIPYNPPQIKDPFTVACLCCIKYYVMKKDKKNSELCAIYLSFSGKFYASLHSNFFQYLPSKPVMDYVVNFELTDKFDIRREGNLFGAIRSMCITWLDTYDKLLKSDFDDDDAGSMIQQLRDREKSFLKNISRIYYKAHANKDYLNYESDNLADGSAFRLADNDALKASNYTEKAINYLTTNTVDFKICKSCSDQNVKPEEIKLIVESILSNNEYLDDIRTVVNTLIVDFMKNNRGKPISSIDFITYSIKTKPNTKDKALLNMKAIIYKWLDEKSPQYVKRKNRPGTQISYYKAMYYYFILIINKVVR